MDGLARALAAIGLVSEQGPALLFGQLGQGIGAPAVGRHVDGDDLVARIGDARSHVTAEGSLTKDCDPKRHGCIVPEPTPTSDEAPRQSQTGATAPPMPHAARRKARHCRKRNVTPPLDTGSRAEQSEAQKKSTDLRANGR